MPRDLLADKKQPRDLLAGASSAQPQAEAQDTPWYQELGQAADDILRIGSNAVTFGFRDKLAPYMTGRTVEEERQMTQDAANRAGSAGLATELLAGAGAPLTAAKVGLTASKAVPATLNGAKGVLARTGAMAGEGSLYGAAYAAGNDQDVLTGMGMGALGGAGGQLLGETGSRVLTKLAPKGNAIPSREQLETMKNAAYKAADDAGIVFKPQAINRVTSQAVKRLSEMGYDPALQPGAAAAIKRLSELRGQNVTLKGLDTVRKVASNGYVPGNRSNNKAIGEIIEAIDDIMTNPKADDILMGDSQTGVAALRDARKLAAQSFKLDKVDDAVARADLRAASTGSGGNVDNATRQNLRRFVEKPRGFSPDEQKALERVVRGTMAQKPLRWAGKLSPSGNGLMAALGIGGTMVNPAIGALALGGMGAKTVADGMTRSNVKKLGELIAAGGSRQSLQAANEALQFLPRSKREALARALMGIGASQAVPAR